MKIITLLFHKDLRWHGKCITKSYPYAVFDIRLSDTALMNTNNMEIINYCHDACCFNLYQCYLEPWYTDNFFKKQSLWQLSCMYSRTLFIPRHPFCFFLFVCIVFLLTVLYLVCICKWHAKIYWWKSFT